MAGTVVYVSKVVRLALLDVDGADVGRVDDVVLGPPHNREPPRVIGFVASVQRRRIFVNAARVGELSAAGVRLHSGTIDVRHFRLRPGELLAAGGLLGRRVGHEVVVDLGLEASASRTRSWEVATVALRPSGLRRRGARVVVWADVAWLFDAGPVAQAVAELRELHPIDVAERVRRLPIARRRQLAEAMEDERLADLLEELPEAEQLRLIEGLDVERLAHVLEEMEPDDAVDLLSEMPGEQRRRLLEAMEPEEAHDLRMLLRYGEHTAGGLMTTEVVVVAPDATVAEALARVREPDLPVTVAAQVFVAVAPTEPPTGPFLGTVGFQRLLREPPSMPVGRCVDPEPEWAPPDLSEARLAGRLAAYDLVALAVCDDDGRLLGAVTVDDVLDHALPEDWRRRR